MTDLTKLAKGRECTVRIPMVCNRDPETTVLAHYRLIGISGMSLKSADLLAAFACYECHEAVDRRSHNHLKLEDVQLAHLEGVMRTQSQLVREGVVTW